MRRRFFEKTYLVTLVLFLIFLNISIIVLCIFTFDSTMESTKRACLAEENAVKSAFENEAATLSDEGVYLLQVSYGSFYREKGIYLNFETDGKATFSSIPDGIEAALPNSISSVKEKDGFYILIKDSIANGKYTMTYAKDVSYLYDEFVRLSFCFVGASLLASAVLAVLLYFVLGKIYAPLENLRKVTENISDGDFSVRIDVSGNDELASLAKDFNIMADKISEQMLELRSVAEQRQRMLDDLAHEMRTPLTGIHGYAEYIRNANITDDERTDATEYIMSEAKRLSGISEILLDTAFIRENKIALSTVSVRELISSTRDRMLFMAQKNNVTLKAQDSQLSIQGDKILVELLLSNLTENAIKACESGGIVELSAKDEHGRTVIYVRDNGIGMTKEQLKHITEPFYRTDKARSRRNGGTGLGLALCSTIADAHGALLQFKSEKGSGTEVAIKF